MKCCSRSAGRRSARSCRACWLANRCRPRGRIRSARPSGWSIARPCRRIFMADRLCAIVVMGVAGSGKTTIGEKLAERLGWTYEDADKFHPATNVAKMSAGQPLTDEDRWPWLRAIADEIDRVCKQQGQLVIGCSA